MREVRTGDRLQVAGSRWRLALPLVAVVVGVVLAGVSVRTQGAFTRHRTQACDGLLPMPVSAFVFGWAGCAVGVVALVVAVVWFRRLRGAGLVVGLGVVALLFEVAALAIAYREAVPIPVLCSG